ncbi:sigma-54 interaction domain-containing protein [Acidocella sp.]|jgi:DNA-binding NtrC family response regulator|uniref:sigma-54 interaction domain-containing protein n=1 Tax=Acidocella sp. TaxID=50710 RepID=UPI002F4188B4
MSRWETEGIGLKARAEDNRSDVDAPLAPGALTGARQYMVGNSPAMCRVFAMIRRVARTGAPVLITGESGTGKELAAQAIHDHSIRRQGPFIPVNCAALPADLIASELFGYEKGAFTGATARKHGLIEAANGGTLFLDEIGDFNINVQAYLLRFLQESTIVRIGGHTPIPVDVRIVSATHVDLAQALAAQRFREDLFYRLNVLTLHMPALRERDDDIQVLAMFFLHRIAAEFGREVKGFDPDALAAMALHPWPGNVRELIASVRRAVVVGNGPWISAAELALTPRPAMSRAPQSPRLAPGSAEERQALLAALERHHHIISRVAAAFGVSRVTLYRMLERHHLCAQDLRAKNAAPVLDAIH